MFFNERCRSNGHFHASFARAAVARDNRQLNNSFSGCHDIGRRRAVAVSTSEATTCVVMVMKVVGLPMVTVVVMETQAKYITRSVSLCTVMALAIAPGDRSSDGPDC